MKVKTVIKEKIMGKGKHISTRSELTSERKSYDRDTPVNIEMIKSLSIFDQKAVNSRRDNTAYEGYDTTRESGFGNVGMHKWQSDSIVEQQQRKPSKFGENKNMSVKLDYNEKKVPK